jgi:hypothetical protein
VSTGFHGFTVAPCNALSVWKRNAKSGRLVRATGIAPAERIRATTTASAGATLPRKAATPAVVGPPSTSRFSLTVNGTPCRGPSERPAATARSAAAAAAIASAANAMVTALTAGFTASILARYAPMTSRLLISLAAIRSARSSAPSAHTSFAIAPPVPLPKLIAPTDSPGLQLIPEGAKPAPDTIPYTPRADPARTPRMPHRFGSCLRVTGRSTRHDPLARHLHTSAPRGREASTRPKHHVAATRSGGQSRHPPGFWQPSGEAPDSLVSQLQEEPMATRPDRPAPLAPMGSGGRLT